jgi:hypothetical protein
MYVCIRMYMCMYMYVYVCRSEDLDVVHVILFIVVRRFDIERVYSAKLQRVLRFEEEHGVHLPEHDTSTTKSEAQANDSFRTYCTLVC